MWEKDFYELSVVAGRQEGMITGAQANRLGVGTAALDHLRGVGLLSELDWDVHQLAGGSLAPRFAYPYAAWLAIRPETFRWERPDGPLDVVLSHESACGLHGLGSVAAPLMTFTAAEELPAPRATRIHVSRLSPEDVMVHRGVLVTTPLRTLLDLVADWVEHAHIQRAVTDAVRRDLVDLRVLHEGMKPLAEEHDYPVDGPEFVGYFMPHLQPGSLSVRNLRAYAALVSGERVAEVRPRVARVLAEARHAFGSPVAGESGPDEVLSRDLAAEIVGRIGWD
jgi:hypothetical protein